MTTFIDKESGAEYEEYRLVSPSDIPNGYKVIHPVNKPNWEVVTRLPQNDDAKYFGRSIVINLTAQPDQAQLIKQSIQAVMEYIAADYGNLGIGSPIGYKKIRDSLLEARNAMKDDE